MHVCDSICWYILVGTPLNKYATLSSPAQDPFTEHFQVFSSSGAAPWARFTLNVVVKCHESWSNGSGETLCLCPTEACVHSVMDVVGNWGVFQSSLRFAVTVILETCPCTWSPDLRSLILHLLPLGNGQAARRATERHLGGMWGKMGMQVWTLKRKVDRSMETDQVVIWGLSWMNDLLQCFEGREREGWEY